METEKVSYSEQGVIVGEISIVTESASDSRTVYGSTSEMARFMRLQQVGFTSAETQNSLIGRAAVAACQKAMRKIRDSHPVLLNHLLKIVKVAGMEKSHDIVR